jgi:tRNA pseudouridine38-40 synthase
MVSKRQVNTMNYKMTIQYDGSRYSGWQRQGNTESTIQGKLEQTLSALTGESIELSGSGRTDAGVHALGQVANFHTAQPLDCGEFLQTLNQALPGDIAVTQLHPASPRFRARLDAKEKTYRYTIRNSVVPDVFSRRYEYQIVEPLDLGAMEQAAKLLLGTHDFRGFSTGHTKKSTVRSLKSICIRQDGSRVELYFTGNGFLYNMVRILTGTLIEVGLGQRQPETILQVLETLDRKQAGFTAPPQGLCLMEVTY